MPTRNYKPKGNEMPQHRRLSDYDRHTLSVACRTDADGTTHRTYPYLQYGFFTMNKDSRRLRKAAAVEIVPMIPRNTRFGDLRRYDFDSISECQSLWDCVRTQVKSILLSRRVFGRKVQNPDDYMIEAYRTESTTALKVKDDWLGVAVPLFERPVPIRFAGAEDDKWEPEDVLYWSETGFKLPGNGSTVMYVIFKLEELV